jgi:hypothetical protein
MTLSAMNYLLYIFVPIPCLNLDFLASYVVVFFYFVFSEWRRDAIDRLVNIGGIVDHHCSNFIFLHYVHLVNLIWPFDRVPGLNFNPGELDLTFCLIELDLTFCPGELDITFCQAELDLTFCPNELELTFCPTELDLTFCPGELDITFCQAEHDITLCPSELELTFCPTEHDLICCPGELDLTFCPVELDLI